MQRDLPGEEDIQMQLLNAIIKSDYLAHLMHNKVF